VGFHVVRPDDLDWDEYSNYAGRFRAALTDLAGLRHTRANLIRHAPGDRPAAPRTDAGRDVRPDSRDAHRVSRRPGRTARGPGTIVQIEAGTARART